MTLALIGSQAFLHRFGTLDRRPRDIDIVGTYDDVMAYASTCGEIIECYPIEAGKKFIIRATNELIEAEIAWEGSSAERLLCFIQDDPETWYRYGPPPSNPAETLMVASLDVLYMLKMSHRYLKDSPHFLKTMRDIQRMRLLGAKISDEAFLKDREKATYTYEHPKLNTTKDNFFKGDGVGYQFDHDTIHIAVAHLDKPAYKYYQPEDSQVNVGKKLFFEQPENIRLLGVLEEAYVLAIERSQLPHPGTPPKKSFDIALKKVCTSITSGWFREYSWEHYDAVQALYSDDYVKRFQTAVENGIVRPYEG
jgi:hypothetical protein